MRTRRARRQRGAIAHLIVISTAIASTSLVYMSEVTVGSFAREEGRCAVSEEAFALAEGGVVSARAALEAGRPFAPLRAAHLGRGTVDVVVEHGASEIVITSTGTVVASVLGGMPGPISRRVRVRLSAKSLAALEWKEL